MFARARLFTVFVLTPCIALLFWLLPSVAAHEGHFAKAPAAAAEMKNPYAGNPQAAAAGKKLYGQNCAQCHGPDRQGMNNAPSLKTEAVQTAKPGALFWFITNGDLQKGMPSWTNLPKPQRWQIVTFLQSEKTPEQ